MRLCFLTVLLSLFLNKECIAEAKRIFPDFAEPIGTCNGQVIFTGSQSSQVYYGVYRTNGTKYSLVRDYFDFGGVADSPWGESRQVPSLNAPVPLLFRRDRSESKTGLGVTCGTLKSTKTVNSNIQPYFLVNYLATDDGLYFRNETKRSTELWRLSSSNARRLAKVSSSPAKSERFFEDKEIFLTAGGIVFGAYDQDTKLRRLWVYNSGSTQLLSDFSSVAAAGYTNITVHDASQAGTDHIFFNLDATNSTTQVEERLYFISDGVTVTQLSLEGLGRVRDVYNLPGVNGLLLNAEVAGSNLSQCKLVLLSLPAGTIEDLSSDLGEHAAEFSSCQYGYAAGTSDSSFFFTDRATSTMLSRFNIASREITELLQSDTRIFDIWHLGGRIYFQVIDSEAERGALWVSDGTEAGTVVIAAAGNPLLGVEIRQSVVLDDFVYLYSFTKVGKDSEIKDGGLYRFIPPVGEITE